MMTYSTDGGRTWSARKADLDLGNRAELPPASGSSARPHRRRGSPGAARHHLQHEHELHRHLDGVERGSLVERLDVRLSRRMNQRAMALQIQNGVPVASPASSVQVSRYSYDDDTKPGDRLPTVTRWRRTPRRASRCRCGTSSTSTTTTTGKSPFAGDYTDIRPLTPNTFITAFTDNRFVVPPAAGTGGATSSRGRTSRITVPGRSAPTRARVRRRSWRRRSATGWS